MVHQFLLSGDINVKLVTIYGCMWPCLSTSKFCMAFTYRLALQVWAPKPGLVLCCLNITADSGFAPRQWETVLLRNDVSHYLVASLESALYMIIYPATKRNPVILHYVHTTMSISNIGILETTPIQVEWWFVLLLLDPMYSKAKIRMSINQVQMTLVPLDLVYVYFMTRFIVSNAIIPVA